MQGRGHSYGLRQRGEEMETVSCLAPLNNSRCLYATAAKKRPQGKTVARYWQPVTGVQYIDVCVCVVSLSVHPSVCAEGHQDRETESAGVYV